MFDLDEMEMGVRSHLLKVHVRLAFIEDKIRGNVSIP